MKPLDKGEKWEDRVSVYIQQINVQLVDWEKDYRVAAGKNEDGYYLVYRRLNRDSADDWFHTSGLVSHKPREFSIWLNGYVTAMYALDPREGYYL